MHPLPGALLLLLVGASADLNIQVQVLAPDTLSASAFVSNLQALAAGNATNATNYTESPAAFLPVVGVGAASEQPALCVGSDCYVQGATVQTTTTPAPPATTPAAQNAPDIPTIAGATVGGVCGLIVIVLVVYYLCRRPSRLGEAVTSTLITQWWLSARPPKPRVAIRATIDWPLQKPAPPPANVPGARPQQVWQIRKSRWRSSGSSTWPRATT